MLEKKKCIWHSIRRERKSSRVTETTEKRSRQASKERRSSLSSINWPLLNFNKPSKDRFQEMPRVLHLRWKYFTLSLKQRNRTAGKEPELAHFFFFWGTTGKRKEGGQALLHQDCGKNAPTSQSPLWWQFWVWLMSPPVLLALLPPGLLHSFNFHSESESASSVKKAPKCCGGNKREMQILVLPGRQEIWTVSTEMSQRAAEM